MTTAAATVLDLDDTSGCPVADVCAGCARPDAELAAITAQTPVGTVCLTLCPVCTDAGIVPLYTLTHAVNGVLDHCAHLNIDVDAMVDALTSEYRPTS